MHSIYKFITLNYCIFYGMSVVDGCTRNGGVGFAPKVPYPLIVEPSPNLHMKSGVVLIGKAKLAMSSENRGSGFYWNASIHHSRRENRLGIDFFV